MSLVIVPGPEWGRTGIGTSDYRALTSTVLKSETSQRREEAVAHLVMGHRRHSLEVIQGQIGIIPPSEQDMITFATFEEHLQHLKKNEDHIVCFGKSGIQGWGLFARRPIQEGQMIIEYRGELIRLSVSDAREKQYQSKNKHCYFFQVSDQVVIDATDKGNVARFINHSCQPNCFARKLPMGNTTQPDLFVARKNISAGQELTLDYMFEVATSEQNRVPCLCNAPNCRGYMA